MLHEMPTREQDLYLLIRKQEEQLAATVMSFLSVTLVSDWLNG